MKFGVREFGRVGSIQRHIPGPVQNTFLRGFLQRIKEREQMLLWKFSKTSDDGEGKRREKELEMRVLIHNKPEYWQVQRERWEQKSQKRLVEQLRQRVREFMDRIQFGLFGGKLEGGGRI